MIDDKLEGDGESLQSNALSMDYINKRWSSLLSDFELILEELFLQSSPNWIDLKLRLDETFYHIIQILIQFDIASGEFLQFSAQLVSIFAKVSFSPGSLREGMHVLIEILQKIASTTTWMTPVLCQILVVLLFQIQFMSGVAVTEEICQKLSGAGQCLEAIEHLVTAGKSLSVSAWHSLKQYIAEEMERTMKCSRSLVGYRFFYLLHLLAFLLQHRLISPHLVSLLIKIFQLADRVDDSKSKSSDDKGFLLLVAGQGQRDQPCSSQPRHYNYNNKRELSYGAGYWNEKVLSQYFEDKEDLVQPTTLPTHTCLHAQRLHQHLLTYNQHLISTHYSFTHYLEVWLQEVWRGGAVTSLQQRLLSELFQSYLKHIEDVVTTSMKEEKKRNKKRKKSQLLMKEDPLLFPSLYLPAATSSTNTTTPSSSHPFLEQVRESRGVTLAYYRVFVLSTSSFTTSKSLVEMCDHLLQYLERSCEGVVGEEARMTEFFYLQFLTCFLSHSPILSAFSADFIVRCMVRLLRWLVALLQCSGDSGDVSNTSFLIYCIQSVFYILLHRVDICGSGRGGVEIEEEVRRWLIMIMKKDRTRHSFTCAQWLYIHLFFLPLHGSSQEEVVRDVIQLQSPLRKEWEEECQRCDKGAMVFALAPHSPISNLFQTMRSSPHLLQSWQEVLSEEEIPNPHNVTRLHLHLFLQHCRHLLIVTASNSSSLRGGSSAMGKLRRCKGVAGEPLTDVLTSELLLHVFSYLSYKRIVKLTQLSKSTLHLLATSQRHIIFWRDIYFRSFPKHRFLNEDCNDAVEDGVKKECIQCRALRKQLVEKKKEIAKIKGKVCQSKRCHHLWFHLLKHRIVTLSKAKANRGRKNDRIPRLCPIIGCNMIINASNKGEEVR